MVRPMAGCLLLDLVLCMGQQIRDKEGVHQCGKDSKDDYSRNQPMGEEIFSFLFTGLS
ncbi:hypothetical protein [uncultured Desulfobulbus sp.]|uniref:hypothetical protein n=1 Tax=uncultured Desulfobulbus sp. TaxID=239745 RepID=UPI0029C657A3|nr:hypothetical protein [uncultured Desulfobulbus sp.]